MGNVLIPLLDKLTGKLKPTQIPDLSGSYLTPAAGDGRYAPGGTTGTIGTTQGDVRYPRMAPAPSGDTTGATDTAALEAYVAAQVAASTGQVATVQLQRGTYWLQIQAATAARGGWAITLPSGATGIELVGAGVDLTTVKLAASQGAYLTLFQASGDVGRLAMHDFTVDHNEQNNSSHVTQAAVAGGTAGGMTLNVAQSRGGSPVVGGASGGVDIRRVKVKNYDSVNTINLHGDNGITLGPCILEGLHFFPAAITGANDHDHSTIYWQETVSTYYGIEVRGCKFFAPTGLPTLGAAIECHGSGYDVHDNVIVNYPVGVQATAVAKATTEQVRVHHNRMRGVAIGVQVVVLGLGTFTSGVGLNGMRIESNDMLIDRDQWWTKTNGVVALTGCGVLFNQPNAAFEVRNVDIDNNRIRYATITSLASGTDNSLSHGIVYYRPAGGTDKRLRIRWNTIEAAPMAAIWLNPSTASEFETDGNTIIDPASISNPGVTVGIFCAPAVSIADSVLRGDRITDSKATATMTNGFGLFTTHAVTNCEVVDAKVRRVNGTQVNVTSQGTAAGAQWFQRGRQTFVPGNFATYGSTMVDDTNGKVWVQTTSPAGNNWVQQALP